MKGEINRLDEISNQAKRVGQLELLCYLKSKLTGRVVNGKITGVITEEELDETYELLCGNGVLQREYGNCGYNRLL